MKLAIIREGNQIATNTDFSDVRDKGEIAHFLAELELIKQDLLTMWEEYETS